MTITISTPVRVAALCGALLALGGGAFMMLGLHHASNSEPVVAPPPTTAHRSPPRAAATTPAHTTPAGTHATTSPASTAATHSAAHTAAASSHASAETTKHAAAARVDATLPVTLRQVLAHHKLAVAIVYAPGFPGEAQALSAARAGARQAHAGFAVLDIRDEKTAVAVAERFPGVSDPTVLIVRRSGDVAFELDGVQETTTIAQAALQAKR